MRSIIGWWVVLFAVRVGWGRWLWGLQRRVGVGGLLVEYRGQRLVKTNVWCVCGCVSEEQSGGTEIKIILN